jgi:hypothetical protein
VVFLEYIRNRLCRDLVGASVDPANHFAELPARISGSLSTPGTDPLKVEDLILDLQRVREGVRE